MKIRKLNIMMVAAVIVAISGCGTVSVQQLSETYDRPILSVAEARSMIRVEVAALRPVSLEDTAMAATD